MGKSSIDHILSVELYLPKFTSEEIDQATEVTSRVEQEYRFTKEDFATLTETHSRVFDRLLQIDPTIRHDRVSNAERANRNPFIYLMKRCSKSEAKLHLENVHSLFDKYQVPFAARREFFKAIAKHWYLSRAMAYSQDAERGENLLQ